MKFRDALWPADPISDLRELVNRSADLHGDWPAYYVKDRPGGPYRAISFKEYRRDVSALGTAFIEMGLQGKKVAVIGENRYEWILTYLATTCMGGVIVPIDRELSAEEVTHLLDRSGAVAFVYSGKSERLVDAALEHTNTAIQLISMDAQEDVPEKRSLSTLLRWGYDLMEKGHKDFFQVEIDPNKMCSLIYTSGTTGLAKGVMLSHRNLTANVVAMAEFVNVIGWTALSVLPMHHTYEFSCGILGTYYQGCAVAICEGLKYIVKNMGESKANVLLGVPLMFEKMHQKVWKEAENSGKAKTMRRAIAVSKKVGGQKLKATKKLFKAIHQSMGGEMRTIIAGGAAANPAVIEDFNAMGFNMLQGYGMTENSPIIAVNKDRCSKPSSAGIPLSGTEVKIVDPDEDGIGEIVFRGPSVMLGYYDDPEETAKVLRDGWLYSGDYGYIDKDGFVFITGRKKNVIVTKNGKNIFPEEVEYYLLRSPFIEEVVVWGKDEDSGDTVLCADIFPDYEYLKENFAGANEEDIRKWIDSEVDKANEQMPSYKRVKRFFVRDTEFEKTTKKSIKRHTIAHNN
ncbi:MAG: AMP-binding protein [Clostridiales Family XIII bacterium]|jgi:long-chain acyl-CoA synthetase|nr:AMP-binding protein [Clostridiales Family XIII bacterium]